VHGSSSSMIRQLFTAVVISVAGFYHAGGQPYDAYVTHPKSGDVVYAGGSFNVTWFVDPSFTTLNLCIFGPTSGNPGPNVNWYIARNIPNTGMYAWGVEPIWASGSGYWMILNRADWNTNDEVSPFTMVSLEDQVTPTSSISSGVPSGSVSPSTVSSSPHSKCFSPGSVGGIVAGVLGGMLILVLLCLWLRRSMFHRKAGTDTTHAGPHVRETAPNLIPNRIQPVDRSLAANPMISQRATDHVMTAPLAAADANNIGSSSQLTSQNASSSHSPTFEAWASPDLSSPPAYKDQWS
jgi:hypothetical protein